MKLTEQQQKTLQDVKERLAKVEALIPDERYTMLVQSLRDDIRLLLGLVEVVSLDDPKADEIPLDSQPRAYHLAWELRNIFEETPFELENAADELLRLQHESNDFRKALWLIAQSNQLEYAIDKARDALWANPAAHTSTPETRRDLSHLFPEVE